MKRERNKFILKIVYIFLIIHVLLITVQESIELSLKFLL